MKTREHPLVLVPASEDILHFALPGLLPEQAVLAFNPALGTLSCLDVIGEELRLVAQEQFTASEACVLLPLLKAFPHHCPYEVLHASFNSTTVTEQAIERSRRRLLEAQRDGTWEEEMRPVRNVLSRTRIKLQRLGVNVLSILETGCLLLPMHQRGKRAKVAKAS